MQWSYGGVDVGTVLMLIELTAEGNDQKVESGITLMDACSKISLKNSKLLVCLKQTSTFQRAWTSATPPPGSWIAARTPTLSFWRTWWPLSISSKLYGRIEICFFHVSRDPQKQEDVPLPRLKAKCPDAHKCIINVSHFLYANCDF